MKILPWPNFVAAGKDSKHCRKYFKFRLIKLVATILVILASDDTTSNRKHLSSGEPVFFVLSWLFAVLFYDVACSVC